MATDPLDRLSHQTLVRLVRCRQHEAAVVVGLVLAALLLALPPAAFAISSGLLTFGAWRLAAVVFGPRRVVDRLLLAWMLAIALVSVVGEALSLVGLFGRPRAWLAATGAIGLAGALLGPRTPGLSWEGATAPLRALHWAGQALLAVFGLQLATVFFLTWYAGINVFDSISTYLPQSVRYLQQGGYTIQPDWLDYFPQLHQTLVAYQLVFLEADVLVNLLSFVTALMTGVGLYAMTSSVGWRGPLPLLTALLPFTMPLFLIHASDSRFDILEALWLLLTLYFVRRGLAGTTVRWLAAAAITMGLALATKPTFWFAAPGLAVVWLAVGARALRRGRARRLAVTVAACGALFLVIGAPFLVRNYAASGSPLGSSRSFEVVAGRPLQLSEYAQRAGLHLLAYGFQLLTPPSILPPAIADRVEEWFADLAEALGYALPDPRLAMNPSLRGLIRHVSERYSDGHASFGAAFLLVIVPSLAALPLLHRRLGPRAIYPAAAVLVALSYLVVIGLAVPYDVANIRYVVEPVVLLAVAAPAALSLLSGRSAAIVALLVALPLLAEMNDVVRHNRHLPLHEVLRVPRDEQYLRFFGDRGELTLQAARAFERKYPPSAYPLVYLYHLSVPLFPDYVFRGPTLGRRYAFYVPSPDRPVLPGPLLIQDARLANELIAALDPVVDRLSADTYLLLSRDRFRVVFDVAQATVSAEPMLRLRAYPAAVQAAPAEIRFVLVSPTGERVLRDFAADPSFALPLLQTIGNRIRVDERANGQSRVSSTVELDYRQFLYR